MFSWGGCLIKLLISVAVACSTGKDQAVWVSIVMGVLVYSIISAWWYCCCLSGNFIIGTILFLVVVFVATWGASAAQNIVLRIISGIVLVAIALGGVIADIKGMIDRIRCGV